METSKLKLIIAINNLGYIGKDGGMMWKSSDDLRHFKKLTEGLKCLVGNTTKKGLPPLRNREIIVVGHDEGCYTLEEALAMNPDWIIGGATIYKQTLHLSDELHVSHINDDTIGDTSFEIPEDYKGQIFHYYFETNDKL